MSKLRYASILMSLLTLLAGCGICETYNGLAAGFLGQPTPVPNSDDLRGFSISRPIIESPLNNSELPLLPFVISTYAGHPAGAVQAVLVVNGVDIQTDPVVAEQDPKRPEIKVMTKIDQVWTPPGPGAYYLQVRVTWADGAGTEITYPVLVYVGGVPTLDFTQLVEAAKLTATAQTGTAPATNTPTATLSPTVGASPTQPRITFTPSRTSSVTSTLQATATLTPTLTSTVALGAPFVNFSADSTSINAGQCTTLHWNSGNITAIFLNNEGTVGTLDKQVCPTTTTLYRLRATTQSSGDIIKEITITVTGPTATNTVPGAATATHTATSTTAAANPPQIGSLNFSTNQVTNHAACGGNSVNVTVQITNAINVTLSFSTSGSSGSKAMSDQGGNNWAASVSVDDDNGDLPSLPTGPIQFSVSASGPGGSNSSGPVGGVTIMNCES
jgi:hypothetical protein